MCWQFDTAPFSSSTSVAISAVFMTESNHQLLIFTGCTRVRRFPFWLVYVCLYLPPSWLNELFFYTHIFIHLSIVLLFLSLSHTQTQPIAHAPEHIHIFTYHGLAFFSLSLLPATPLTHTRTLTNIVSCMLTHTHTQTCIHVCIVQLSLSYTHCYAHTHAHTHAQRSQEVNINITQHLIDLSLISPG